MSIYKHSAILSLVVSLISLVGALILANGSDALCVCAENISIGLFASGILLFGSSFIGYVKEERRTFREFHWQLNLLKLAVVNFQTLQEYNTDTYYEAITGINQVLKNYFCNVDLDFFFKKRKKVKFLLDVYNDLELLNNVTGLAMIKVCEFRTRKTDASGQRTYPLDKFKEDTRSFISAMDNYKDSGYMMAIWIEQKENEYGKVVFGFGRK